MSTVIFAGPSLFGAPAGATSGMEVRRPALRGDIRRAVGDGARVIGLIDGVFETVPAVWHKEILQALSQGIAVFGASSMGALRAAECQSFGMIGVGRIFEEYADGRRVADADVAVAHAPAALGHRPLTLALVDAQAALQRLVKESLISQDLGQRLVEAAEQLHFKRRDWPAVLDRAGLGAAENRRVLDQIERQDFSQKREDALQLLDRLRGGENLRAAQPAFRLSRTHYLDQLTDA